MTLRNGWSRVNRQKPCPICERPDWCLLSSDGGGAICARVESPKRCGEAGWLHRLRDEPFQPPRSIVRSISLAPPGPRLDLAKLAAAFQKAVHHDHLNEFARTLGLSVASITSLGVGWSEQQRAWSFPMTDAAGHVLGIRLRGPTGIKFAVKGGREGLFIPAGECPNSTLFICEGPTGTAALLDLGFAGVVGRPSCTGGIKLLVNLVRERDPEEVVIVADADEVGKRGAANLAAVLAVYVPAVRVIGPPEGIKDARAWLQAGGKRAEVEQVIQATPVRRLGIRR